MRWRQGRRSQNIEDRRGESAPQMGAAGMGGLLRLAPLLLRSKKGWLILAILFAVSYFGGGFDNQTQTPRVPTASIDSGAPSGSPAAASDESAEFVSVILADTEDTWGQIFQTGGARYQTPTLVLYSDAVRSACGLSTSAVGPFYCPGDQQVYLDLSFLNDLRRLGAPGDFAFAYVIAHEVGHHVQNLLGTSAQVQQMRSRTNQVTGNRLSVMLELQADCYAGVWAHHAHRQRQMLEPGDLEEGLQAAAAVGDDRLQRRAGQAVSPDAFTHGSSEQRSFWFRQGFDSGDLNRCDTFASLSGG